MSLTTRLDATRDAVRRTANVVQFTEAHPDSRINDLICQGWASLSRLCRTTNPEFRPIASATVTTDGTNTLFSLPAGFRSLLSVEYQDANSRKNWLRPFELSERAILTEAAVQSASLRAQAYRIMGSSGAFKIELLPLAPTGHTATLWYASTESQPSADSDQVDTMERLDTYVIWWAAREIAGEREAWERHDRLGAKLESLEAEIRIMARSIDLSHPARVNEVYPHRAQRARDVRYGGRRFW